MKLAKAKERILEAIKEEAQSKESKICQIIYFWREIEKSINEFLEQEGIDNIDNIHIYDIPKTTLPKQIAWINIDGQRVIRIEVCISSMPIRCTIEELWYRSHEHIDFAFSNLEEDFEVKLS